MNSKTFFLAFLIANLLFPSLFNSQIFTFPKNRIESTISSFENLNGKKASGGKRNLSAKGNAFESLRAGTSKTLLETTGAGTIQRIWITLPDRSPNMLRSVRLRIFWDGELEPAVDVPLGDFFGFGLSKIVKMENEFFSSAEGRSFNCYIPMPFRKGAKVQIINESSQDIEFLFFDIDYVKVEKHDTNTLYFHAFWSRKTNSQLGENFVFLPTVLGKGRFLGTNIGVLTTKDYGSSWWGEGEVKMFIDDDDKYPTWNGTGAEDYAGTAWGMEVFNNKFQGCTVADEKKRQFAFYRFHIPDEIYFNKKFRAEIQQIGGAPQEVVHKMLEKNIPLKIITVGGPMGFFRLLEQPIDIKSKDFPDGWINFYRTDDYSATSYFYLDSPVHKLENLPPVSERIYTE
ncbi:glycoside hydrolase family 172 protein [Chryseobacterium sp. SC28]|uniref:glycoside hydrolase family 172 protein n=1 Tax=Chryseobacterium sp. SC28 TaxID=2268028 RepID=UPI000F64AF9E|nr:glycoside hydrolase family 172 protein [Chryseobacterium sp. SC28]RRQ46033.1 DUF2961 domain-containing protein [Chryseobacterium sp. SC28]